MADDFAFGGLGGLIGRVATNGFEGFLPESMTGGGAAQPVAPPAAPPTAVPPSAPSPQAAPTAASPSYSGNMGRAFGGGMGQAFGGLAFPWSGSQSSYGGGKNNE